MKAKYTFLIKSHSRTDTGIKFIHDTWEYDLTEEKGEITKISITVPNFPKQALPLIASTPELEIKMSVTIPKDPLIEDILSKIRTIEGSLSFWGINEIKTEEYKREWIPESEEERTQLQMFSYSSSFNETPIKDRPKIFLDLVVRSIISTDKLESLEIALNFNRRGKLDAKQGKYIEAIYDYFFFLEHLYSGGKFKSKELATQFEKSEELVNYIEKTKSDISSYEPEFTTSTLLQEISIETTQKTIRRIIKLRGFLHHHSKSNTKTWHPSKQQEFKDDATFLMHLCHNIAIEKCTAELFTEECLRKFCATTVVNSENQRIRWPDIESLLP